MIDSKQKREKMRMEKSVREKLRDSIKRVKGMEEKREDTFTKKAFFNHFQLA